MMIVRYVLQVNYTQQNYQQLAHHKDEIYGQTNNRKKANIEQLIR